MESILITGSNRGLGLEWARQYAESGWRVYATCRNPEQADELRALSRTYPALSLHRLDVTDADQLASLGADLAGAPIDILLNNAGVYFEKFTADNLGHIVYGEWEETFRVNTLGAVRVTEALRSNLHAGRRRLVVVITSHMGSIAEIGSPGSYAYRSSKAALNAAMKGISLELQQEDVGVLLLHPGWVKTRMGGPGALLTTTESVAGMRKQVEEFNSASSGRFFRYDGSEIPW